MVVVNTLQVSLLQAVGRAIGSSLRFTFLAVLYFIVFAAGGSLVAPYLPATPAQAGPVPEMTGLLIVCAATVLVIMSLIHSSRWHGWKLIASTSVACYLVMGRFRPLAGESAAQAMESVSLKEWLGRLGVIYIAYLVLYYTAGYFIAWQNPEVRAFYGSPGAARPFFQQMLHIFTTDPWLTPYQLLRTLIWVAGAYPIIRGSRLPLW